MAWTDRQIIVLLRRATTERPCRQTRTRFNHRQRIWENPTPGPSPPTTHTPIRGLRCRP